MNRCFIDRSIWRENESDLSAEESHHLLDVLRAKPGEIIEIFDGQGRTASAELIDKRKPIRQAQCKHLARVKILPETVRIVEPYCPAFILLQAIPKHSGMEAIIQKATELGVRQIMPLMTERVIVRLNESAAAQRVERWQKIALASVKQCRSAWLPTLGRIVPLAEAVAGDHSDLKIFGGLAPQTPGFRETLRTFDATALKSITLVIGPEGDLTDKEQDLLRGAGYKPVSFGDEVLRVETAVIFGLSALNYEFRQKM